MAGTGLRWRCLGREDCGWRGKSAKNEREPTRRVLVGHSTPSSIDSIRFASIDLSLAQSTRARRGCCGCSGGRAVLL